jgi:transcriptional regulator with XRE-family HTH domain
MAQQWHDLTTGERIRFLRGSMTQQALSEAAGVSIHLVQKVEQGKNVSLPSLMKLAEGLGRDLSVILGDVSPHRAALREEVTALRSISVATHEAGRRTSLRSRARGPGRVARSVLPNLA